MWCISSQHTVNQACTALFNLKTADNGLHTNDDQLLDAANCLDAPDWLPAGSAKQFGGGFRRDGALEPIRALPSMLERSPA